MYVYLYIYIYIHKLYIYIYVYKDIYVYILYIYRHTYICICIYIHVQRHIYIYNNEIQQCTTLSLIEQYIYLMCGVSDMQYRTIYLIYTMAFGSDTPQASQLQQVPNRQERFKILVDQQDVLLGMFCGLRYPQQSNMAMKHPPFMDDFPIETSIYIGFPSQPC